LTAAARDGVFDFMSALDGNQMTLQGDLNNGDEPCL